MSREDKQAQLEALCRQGLFGRLIMASNRGPVEYHFTDQREHRARRGSGGVVTALSGLSRHLDLMWIASAMGEGDRHAAAQAGGGPIKVSHEDERLSLRYIINPRSMYHRYYNVFCNPLLWFLHHSMWDSSRSPNIDRVVYDAWEKGYVPVNEAFARVVIEEANRSKPPPLVLLNDYHLYLAGSYIRQALPDQIIQHFIHIPWPSPTSWQLLPAVMREAILRSLCTCDIVGLQTVRDVNSFLSCCASFLKEAEIDNREQNVHLAGHTVRVRAYPISVDVPGLNRIRSSGRLKEYEEKLSPLCGEKTIVRVDRMEPTKNIIRGFRAFDMFFERYPEFRGRVKFISFLVPSRAHLRVYQRYNEDVQQQIENINRKYGTDDWQPITYFYENNYTQALAGMTLYDVLLVNAVADGMNLVAKEGPTVNDRDGVLVISEGVGACEQLQEYALTVSPADLEGTVQALYQALVMPAEEKHRRARSLKQVIAEEDLPAWVLHLMEDAVNLIKK